MECIPLPLTFIEHSILVNDYLYLIYVVILMAEASDRKKQLMWWWCHEVPYILVCDISRFIMPAGNSRSLMSLCSQNPFRQAPVGSFSNVNSAFS